MPSEELKNFEELADPIPVSSEQYALTTFDNPYDPFEDYPHWFQFDVDHGYSSSSYLARIARVSDQFTDEENNIEIERAIDEIIKYDFMNIYRKVKRKSK